MALRGASSWAWGRRLGVTSGPSSAATGARSHADNRQHRLRGFPPVRRYRFIGTEGTLEWDLARCRLELLRSTVPDRAWNMGFDMSRSYVLAMSRFLRGVEGGPVAGPDLSDGIATLRIALNARSGYAV